MFKLLFLVIGILMMSNCAPLYIPATRPYVFPDSSRTKSLNLSMGSSGLDIQYAGTIGAEYVMFTAVSLDSRNDSTQKDYHRHVAGEIGIGRAARSKYLAGAILFGGGIGYTRSYATFIDVDILAQGNYGKIFFQTDGALHLDFLEFIISHRISYIHFFEINNFHNNEPAKGILKSAFFSEPVFIISGGEALKTELQIGISLPLTQAEIFEYQPYMVSLGFRYFWK
jgi:hypothetical protein